MMNKLVKKTTTAKQSLCLMDVPVIFVTTK